MTDPYAARNITSTSWFQRARQRAEDWLKPGTGEPADLLDLAFSPDGSHIAASAVIADTLEGVPNQRIALINSESGVIEICSPGPRIDRQPRWSPDGANLLYLSDREQASAFVLVVREMASGAEFVISIPGHFIESAHWSPDGSQILIQAAGTGADLAGAQGGISVSLDSNDESPAWAPDIDTGIREDAWRSLWICAADGTQLRRVSAEGMTVWECCWCGPDAALVVASDGPAEEKWYTATLRRIDIGSGAATILYTPADQLGWPSANADGSRIAIVEAVCSDRTIVAGTLLVGNTEAISPVSTDDVDVTWTAWSGDDALYFAGHRSFETVLARYTASTGKADTLWASDTLTFGSSRYPEATVCGGRVAALFEGHFSRPILKTRDGDGQIRDVITLGNDSHAKRWEGNGTVEPMRWQAPDGLEIHGWLTRPKGSDRSMPTVIDIHGGPVWLWRPRFLGRQSYQGLLLSAGYAVLQPNIRGSSGRGQPYARQVFGDMGGADTHDILSACDALVARGIADASRIGVTGGSYGGFMSSWLVTQDTRFAAAVPIAPVTDWVSEHLTCHIGKFCEMFLADDMRDPGGRYFTRSPVLQAHKAETPVLLICGALDQNTPPGQALEFHRALLHRGKASRILTYPNEGHGVRNMPAAFDFQARMMDWFTRWMAPRCVNG